MRFRPHVNSIAIFFILGLLFSHNNSGQIIGTFEPFSAEWDVTFGAPGGEEQRDNLTAFIQTRDDGFLLVAGTGSHGVWPTKSDPRIGVWLIKIDRDGRRVWDKIILEKGGAAPGDITASIKPTRDGNYVITAIGKYLLKFNENGQVLWVQTIAEGEVNYGPPTETTDGGFLLAGARSSTTKGSTGPDLWTTGELIKLDSQGRLHWRQTFADRHYTQLDRRCFLHNVLSDHREGYLVGGTVVTDPPFWQDSRTAMWLISVDEEGQELSNVCYEVADSSVASGRAFAQVSDNVMYYGYTYKFESITQKYQQRATVAKLNPAGSMFWEQIVSPSWPSRVAAVAESHNGGYVFAGVEWENAIWGELDHAGNLLWRAYQHYQGNAGVHWLFGVLPTRDGGYAIAGTSSYEIGGYDCWVKKFKGAHTYSGYPKIWAQPKGHAIPDGSSLLLEAPVAGSQQATYQWRKNGAEIPGATNATFLLKDTTPQTDGMFDAIVRNTHGAVTSMVAVVKSGSAPAILEQPVNQVPRLGEAVKLWINTSGDNL